jgi:hypothetical protein
MSLNQQGGAIMNQGTGSIMTLSNSTVRANQSGVPDVSGGVALGGKQLDEGADPTLSGVILGRPSDMAPEQAGGKSNEVGPATAATVPRF